MRRRYKYLNIIRVGIILCIVVIFHGRSREPRSSIAAAGPARVGGRADPISRPTNVTTSHHYRVTHPPDPPTRAPVSAPDHLQQQPAHRDSGARAPGPHRLEFFLCIYNNIINVCTSCNNIVCIYLVPIPNYTTCTCLIP